MERYYLMCGKHRKTPTNLVAFALCFITMIDLLGRSIVYAI